MKELIKTNFGAVAIAFAILLATIIYVCATRYEHVEHENVILTFDRWTGHFGN